MWAKHQFRISFNCIHYGIRYGRLLLLCWHFMLNLSQSINTILLNFIEFQWIEWNFFIFIHLPPVPRKGYLCWINCFLCKKKYKKNAFGRRIDTVLFCRISRMAFEFNIAFFWLIFSCGIWVSCVVFFFMDHSTFIIKLTILMGFISIFSARFDNFWFIGISIHIFLWNFSSPTK